MKEWLQQTFAFRQGLVVSPVTALKISTPLLFPHDCSRWHVVAHVRQQSFLSLGKHSAIQDNEFTMTLSNHVLYYAVLQRLILQKYCSTSSTRTRTHFYSSSIRLHPLTMDGNKFVMHKRQQQLGLEKLHCCDPRVHIHASHDNRSEHFAASHLKLYGSQSIHVNLQGVISVSSS